MLRWRGGRGEGLTRCDEVWFGCQTQHALADLSIGEGVRGERFVGVAGDDQTNSAIGLPDSTM